MMNSFSGSLLIERNLKRARLNGRVKQEYRSKVPYYQRSILNVAFLWLSEERESWREFEVMRKEGGSKRKR